MKSLKKITCGCLSAAMIVTTLAATPVTVQAAAPKLNKTSAEMTVGKKMTLKVQNAKKGAEIKWSSTKKTVAAVSAKGVVTAKAAGKATIKAVVSKKTLTCKVTVKEKVAPNTNSNDNSSNTNTDAEDISALLAGKSYKGTAATPVGNIDALSITFGSDGTAAGSKFDETTMKLEEFSGAYKAEWNGKKVTITVESNGETFSEELTVESDDFTKMSATKKFMGIDIVITMEEVTEA